MGSCSGHYALACPTARLTVDGDRKHMHSKVEMINRLVSQMLSAHTFRSRIQELKTQHQQT